jgi:hypothetical protein
MQSSQIFLVSELMNAGTRVSRSRHEAKENFPSLVDLSWKQIPKVFNLEDLMRFPV